MAGFPATFLPNIEPPLPAISVSMGLIFVHALLKLNTLFEAVFPVQEKSGHSGKQP